MTSGYTENPELLLKLLRETSEVEGDIVEVGVWEGHKYLLFLDEAEKMQKDCYAIDSFKGLPKPGQYDNAKIYSEGRFNVGGAQWLHDKVKSRSRACICEGFIPELLEHISIEKISFIHIDVDIYEPTKCTFEWAWPILSPGGIIVCHDYKEGNQQNCSRAVREWVEQMHFEKVGLQNTWIWFKKGF